MNEAMKKNQRKTRKQALLSIAISSIILSATHLQAEEYLTNKIIDEHLINQTIEEELIDKIVKKKLSDPIFIEQMKDEVKKRLGYTGYETTEQPIIIKNRTISEQSGSWEMKETTISEWPGHWEMKETIYLEPHRHRDPDPYSCPIKRDVPSSHELPDTPQKNPIFDSDLKKPTPPPNITFFIVPENVACKPKGYSYHCTPLTRDEIDSWRKKQVYATSDAQIKDGKLYLNSSIYDSIEFRDSKPESVVMLFDWDQPQESDIELTRERVDGKGKPIIWKGHLPGHRGWINHQGLSYFYHPGEYRWTLQLGENNWSFKIPIQEKN